MREEDFTGFRYGMVVAMVTWFGSRELGGGRIPLFIGGRFIGQRVLLPNGHNVHDVHVT